MEYLKSKNRILLQCITFIVITAFLCENIGWAGNYRQFEFNAAQSKLAANSLFKLIERYSKDKSQRVLLIKAIKAEALDGFLKDPKTKEDVFEKGKFPKVPGEIGETLNGFFEVIGELKIKGDTGSLQVRLDGNNATMYLFRNPSEVQIDPDIGIKKADDLAIARARGYWFKVDLILEPDLYGIMKEQGIGVPEYRFISSEINITEEIIRQLIRKPGIQHLYMKVVSKSRSAMHKSAVGGVAKIDVVRTPQGDVDIETTVRNLKAGYCAVIERVTKQAGINENEIAGVLLCEEIVHKYDDEYFIGYLHDHAFGSFIAIGKGGTGIEKQEKGNIVYIPIGIVNGDELMRQLDTWLESANISKELWRYYKQLIPQVITLVNRFNEKYPDNMVQEFELNPVVAVEDKFIALDARMIIGVKPEKKELARGLEYLFEPKKLNVAVIGASSGGGLGANITFNMINDSRLSNVFLVNPKNAQRGETIYGRTVYKDVTEIKERVDVVFVAINAKNLGAAMQEIIQKAEAQKKQQELAREEVTPITVVLISGGMAEAGEAGRDMQDRLLGMVREAQDKGMRINVIGPNCLGFYVSGCNGFFSTREHFDMPDFGKENNVIALVARSGGRIGLFLEMMNEYLIQQRKSISAAFSVGNCMDLCEADYVNAILDGSPEVKVIALYLEGFSEGKGLELCKAIKRAKKQGKAVVIYLAGRNEKSLTAIQSHTASLASPYNRAVIALKIAGAELVDIPIQLEERVGQIVFNDEEFKIPQDTGKETIVRGNGNIAAICYSGQSAVQLTDTNLPPGLKWVEFSDRLSGELKALLPPIIGTTKRGRIPNPIDTTPGINDKQFVECVEKLCKSDDVDTVIVSMFPQMDIPKSQEWDTEEDRMDRSTITILKKIVDLKRRYPDKPILVCISGPHTGRFKDLFRILEEGGIPTFSYDYQAVSSLKYVCDTVCESAEHEDKGMRIVRKIAEEERENRTVPFQSNRWALEVLAEVKSVQSNIIANEAISEKLLSFFNSYEEFFAALNDPRSFVDKYKSDRAFLDSVSKFLVSLLLNKDILGDIPGCSYSKIRAQVEKLLEIIAVQYGVLQEVLLNPSLYKQNRKDNLAEIADEYGVDILLIYFLDMRYSGLTVLGEYSGLSFSKQEGKYQMIMGLFGGENIISTRKVFLGESPYVYSMETGKLYYYGREIAFGFKPILNQENIGFRRKRKTSTKNWYFKVYYCIRNGNVIPEIDFSHLHINFYDFCTNMCPFCWRAYREKVKLFGAHFMRQKNVISVDKGLEEIVQKYGKDIFKTIQTITVLEGFFGEEEKELEYLEELVSKLRQAGYNGEIKVAVTTIKTESGYKKLRDLGCNMEEFMFPLECFTKRDKALGGKKKSSFDEALSAMVFAKKYFKRIRAFLLLGLSDNLDDLIHNLSILTKNGIEVQLGSFSVNLPRQYSLLCDDIRKDESNNGHINFLLEAVLIASQNMVDRPEIGIDNAVWPENMDKYIHSDGRLGVIVRDNRDGSGSEINRTCGTICKSGHQELLDPQLEVFYNKLASEGGITRDLKQEPLTGDEVIGLLEKTGKVDQDTAELLRGIKIYITDTLPDIKSQNIQLLFAIPKDGMKLWWIDDPDTGEPLYAGGHFNGKGTRIHISLPLILSQPKPEEAALAIAKHDLAHIQGKRHQKDEGMRLVRGIASEEELIRQVENDQFVRSFLHPEYETFRITLPEYLYARVVEVKHVLSEMIIVDVVEENNIFKGSIRIPTDDPSAVAAKLKGARLILPRSFFREKFLDFDVRIICDDGEELIYKVFDIALENIEPVTPFSSFEQEKEFRGVFNSGYKWRFVRDVDGIFYRLSLMRWMNLLPLYTSGWSHDNAPLSHAIDYLQNIGLRLPVERSDEEIIEWLKSNVSIRKLLEVTGEADYILDQANRYHTGFITFTPDKNDPIYKEFETAVGGIEDVDIIESSLTPGVYVLRVKVPDNIVQSNDVGAYQRFMERKWLKVSQAIKLIVAGHYDVLIPRRIDRGQIKGSPADFFRILTRSENAGRTVPIKELIEMSGFSEDTIERDMRIIRKSGLVVRENIDGDIAFRLAKEIANSPEKIKIAQEILDGEYQKGQIAYKAKTRAERERIVKRLIICIELSARQKRITKRFIDTVKEDIVQLNEKKIILAWDTDIGEGNRHIALLRELELANLGNIEFVTGTGESLPAVIEKRIGRLGEKGISKDNIEVVVVTKREKGAFNSSYRITRVDDANLSDKEMYVPVLELLTLALKINLEEDSENLRRELKAIYYEITGIRLREDQIGQIRNGVFPIRLPPAEKIPSDFYNKSIEILSAA